MTGPLLARMNTVNVSNFLNIARPSFQEIQKKMRDNPLNP
jgi:hypothetical protein